MDNLMQRNIKLLFAIRALRSSLFAIAIIVPFFQENGLSQTQIFIMQSAFAIGVIALEVPSGYFADHVGRKQSIVLGAIFASIGFAVYSFAYGFWPILAAELTLGIAVSFISGADSALAYDSLKAIKRSDQYRKFESRSFALSGIAEATASLIGGFIAIISLRSTIYAQLGVELMIVPLALMLVEAPRIKRSSGSPFKDILSIVKYSLHGHKEIKWLILYSSALGTMTHTMVWLTQPYYQLVGVSIGWFGALWTFQLLFSAVAATQADRYEKWLGKKKALVSFITIGVVAYLLLGFISSVYVLPVILAFYMIRGLQTPVLRDYMNSIVESDIRATVLSVQSLVQKLLYAFLGPLIGVSFDLYSLQTALLFSGVVYGALGLLALGNMLRLKHI